MPTTTNYIWDEENLLAESDATNAINVVYCSFATSAGLAPSGHSRPELEREVQRLSWRQGHIAVQHLVPLRAVAGEVLVRSCAAAILAVELDGRLVEIVPGPARRWQLALGQVTVGA